MVTVIFDLETSGLNPYHDDIIEIGAKILNSDNSFQCLIKPKSNRPLSQKITQITGITNKQLRTEGKSWENAYSEFYNWFIESTKDSENISVVSHNGDSFDFVFFKRVLKEMNENGTDTSNIDINKIQFVDTLPDINKILCKRSFPGRTYYSQPAIAKTFNIMIVNAHRAMGDVIVLEQIYNQLLKNLQTFFSNLIHLKNQTLLETILT